MVSMTRRERLEAIFAGRVPDRPAVKVWGASPSARRSHSGFEKIRQLALDKTDLFVGARPAFEMLAGSHGAHLQHCVEEPSESPEWTREITTIATPAGTLRQVYLKSTCGKPGYMVEHLLKEPGDVRKLLSLPYEPMPIETSSFQQLDDSIGDQGLAYVNVDHAMYALQRLIGSENFAIWSIEEDGLLREAMEIFSRRLQNHVSALIDAGLGTKVFGWVGPELCIPPLMSLDAFDRYVAALDAPLINKIHDAGGRVWVHCHGKMRCVIGRFMALGVDVLNPIEPPPMGDLTMAEAFDLVEDCMGLEGGVQTHDLISQARDRVREAVRSVLDAGRGRRLILCPSAAFFESVAPSAAELDNWIEFIEFGVGYAQSQG